MAISWPVLKKIIDWIGGTKLFKWATGAIEKQQAIDLAQQQLYREMSENYEKLLLRRTAVTGLEGIKRGSIQRFPNGLNLRFDIFNHYHGSEVFKLPEAGTITAIYGKYKEVEDSKNDGFSANRKAMEAIAEFDKYVRLRRLDLSLLQQVSVPALWDYIKDLVDGKRQSHERDLDPIP